MSDLEISRIRPDEYEAVDAVITAAYEHDYGPRDHGGADEFRISEARAAAFDVWVARDSATGAILGSVTTPKPGGRQLMEDSQPDEFDFRLLGVSPEARGRGIGAALTLHVIDVGRQHGYRTVFMKSAPNMVGAHRLYEKLGFRRDTARDGLILGGVRVRDLYAFVIDTDVVLPAGAQRTSSTGELS